MGLAAQIGLATAMILLTVSMQVAGLLATLAILRRIGRQIDARSPDGLLPVRAVFGRFTAAIMVIFAIHTAQIWAWAVLYLVIGALETMEAALYFSTATFTTVGYGDVVLSEEFRLLSAIESANGIVLIGVSTAVLFAILSRILRDAGLAPRDG